MISPSELLGMVLEHSLDYMELCSIALITGFATKINAVINNASRPSVEADVRAVSARIGGLLCAREVLLPCPKIIVLRSIGIRRINAKRIGLLSTTRKGYC